MKSIWIMCIFLITHHIVFAKATYKCTNCDQKVVCSDTETPALIALKQSKQAHGFLPNRIRVDTDHVLPGSIETWPVDGNINFSPNSNTNSTVSSIITGNSERSEDKATITISNSVMLIYQNQSLGLSCSSDSDFIYHKIAE